MKNCFFPTPESIVRTYLQKEIPERCTNVLEPSVGDGALLKAISGRFDQLTVLDINIENLKRARALSELTDKRNTKFINKDFLLYETKQKFDLVIANPPFKNKLKDFVEYNGRRVPIELAFVQKCISHLSPGGRAVFILPSSIISGEKTRWLRKELTEHYTLNSIYKLKRFSFKKVESGFYVLCLTNSPPLDNLVSLQPLEDDSFTVPHKTIQYYDYEFDPGTLMHRLDYRALARHFGSVRLCEVADLTRGNICATNNKLQIYHTTDFKSLIAHDKEIQSGLESSAKLQLHDLVLKRIGRGSSSSLAMFVGKKDTPCSDCLIRIKPKRPGGWEASNLLLRARVSISLGGKYEFEVSGSGANYISLQKLKNLPLIDIKKFAHESTVAAYYNAVCDGDIFVALSIEESIASMINNEFHGTCTTCQLIFDSNSLQVALGA